MFIKDLLDKYKNIKLVDLDLKNFIASLIETELKQKINIKQITRQGGVINIKADPILKSEILINRNKLLKLIQDFNKTIKDIR